MKKTKVILVLLLFIFLQFIVWGKPIQKSFACRLELKDGRIFQTLILGTDWKEITPKKAETPQTVTGSLKILNHKIVGDNLAIEIITEENSSLSTTIYNLLGEKISLERFSVSKGNGTLFIPLKGLPIGVYICEISNNKTKKVFKFLKF
jgi:hypothetical protein